MLRGASVENEVICDVCGDGICSLNVDIYKFDPSSGFRLCCNTSTLVLNDNIPYKVCLSCDDIKPFVSSEKSTIFWKFREENLIPKTLTLFGIYSTESEYATERYTRKDSQCKKCNSNIMILFYHTGGSEGNNFPFKLQDLNFLLTSFSCPNCTKIIV